VSTKSQKTADKRKMLKSRDKSAKQNTLSPLSGSAGIRMSIYDTIKGKKNRLSE
jgi:hypothetical protein